MIHAFLPFVAVSKAPSVRAFVVEAFYENASRVVRIRVECRRRAESAVRCYTHYSWGVSITRTTTRTALGGLLCVAVASGLWPGEKLALKLDLSLRNWACVCCSGSVRRRRSPCVCIAGRQSQQKQNENPRPSPSQGEEEGENFVFGILRLARVCRNNGAAFTRTQTNKYAHTYKMANLPCHVVCVCV